MSKRQLATLRVLGWRYSTTRKAWVHRAFNGRVGPAFRDRAVLQYDFTIEDLELLDELVDLADVAQPTIVEGERPPLPRRAAVTRRPQIPVEASLDGREPPRVVLVDGRPPRRGVDLRLLRRHDDVVTPIKSSRAASA